jgi:hypothetical protein
MRGDAAVDNAQHSSHYFGAWEWITAAGGVDDADRDAFWLAGSYQMGDTRFSLAYALADDINGVPDSGADQISLGVFHALGRNTTSPPICCSSIRLAAHFNGRFGARFFFASFQDPARRKLPPRTRGFDPGKCGLPEQGLVAVPAWPTAAHPSIPAMKT